MATVSQLQPKSVVKLLSDDATFGTVAHIIAISKYGEAVYEMDILELFADLEEDYRVELSEDVRQKLQAIILATSTDAFYQDPEAFRAIANTLIEGDPGFMFFDNLTLPEIMWSMYEVGLNHPGTDFSAAIKKLIDSEVNDEGLDFDDLDEADEIPSIEATLSNLRNELIEQLASLNLSVAAVPAI